MKTLVICFSYHHKNTAKIALAFAGTLNAEIKTPPEVNLNGLSDFDLIGFGSGIYFGKHHKSLLELADKLPQVTNKKAFIFSTSGRTGNASKFHKQLREKLRAKGFEIAGEFNCAGLDTYGLMKITGGLNKEHPDKDDIKQAEDFAQSLNQQAEVVKS
jgi:flavodoxin